MLVFGDTDGRIRLGPVWRPKLRARNARYLRPERFGGVKVQTVV
jgi:hypothetical protein